MTLISWLLAGCGAGFGTTPSTSLAPTLESPETIHPSPDVTATLTAIPKAGLINPTIEFASSLPYTYAGHLRWFLEEQTILTKMNGITLIHPATGATIKLEEDTAAWFPNPISTSLLSPNGKWIAYAIGTQELVLLDTSTADKKFYILPGEIGSLVWMPDSEHLLLNVGTLEPGNFGAL